MVPAIARKMSTNMTMPVTRMLAPLCSRELCSRELCSREAWDREAWDREAAVHQWYLVDRSRRVSVSPP